MTLHATHWFPGEQTLPLGQPRESSHWTQVLADPPVVAQTLPLGQPLSSRHWTQEFGGPMRHWEVPSLHAWVESQGVQALFTQYWPAGQSASPLQSTQALEGEHTWGEVHG